MIRCRQPLKVVLVLYCFWGWWGCCRILINYIKKYLIYISFTSVWYDHATSGIYIAVIEATNRQHQKKVQLNIFPHENKHTMTSTFDPFTSICLTFWDILLFALDPECLFGFLLFTFTSLTVLFSIRANGSSSISIGLSTESWQKHALLTIWELG